MSQGHHGTQQRLVVRAQGQTRASTLEHLVTERPLHMVINQRPLLTTMRTPGHDQELVLGYLTCEGLLRGPEQVLSWSLRHNERSDTGCMSLRDVAPEALDQLRRVGASVSSCGLCGRAGDVPFTPSAPYPLEPLYLDPAQIPDALARMRQQQALFALTGGLHAAGLLDADGALLCVREDIGRHNAVDKVIGWWVQQGRPGGRQIALLSSGRASFEVAQKAAAAGIGSLFSVSAASSMALDVARELGMYLVGFVRDDRALIYWDPRSPR